MGIIKNGILGGFRNKTGTVVGSYWRTLDVIRSLPRSSGKAPTQLQLNQQLKFGMVTSFLSWFGDLINVGYKSLSGVATPMNVAVSHNLKEAVTGVAPDFTLDYSKISFSSGKLKLPADLSMEAVTDAQVKFSWSYDGEEDRFISGADQISILVYNPDKERFVTLANAADRSALEFTLQLPVSFSGDTVHCYVSFNSVTTKFLVSDSTYTGLLPVL